MKFVYPFKLRGSTFEIYHSIRWLYIAHPDAEVYIIGDAPDIDLPFVHIQYMSYLPFPGSEVTDKIMTFCELIGDEFILMNDDFFITERYPFHRIMTNGYITINPGDCITYQMACENTIDWLASHQLNLINYECHQPVLIQSCRFIELFHDVNYKNHNHLLKSMYFNMWPPIQLPGANLKFGHSLHRAKKALQDYGAFSCADTFLTAENRSYISTYLGFAEQPPSAGCLLCQTQAQPLD